MRTSLIQLPSLANKDEILVLVDDALHRVGDTDLAVLPEGVMHDFRPSVDLASVAEPLDGPFVNGLARIARTHETAVIAGIWEPAGEGRVHNTLVAISASGDLDAAYRKIHLFDSFGFSESERVAPGPVEPTIIDLAGVRLGLMTCYDLRFPELARRLVELGATALVVPAGWVSGPNKVDHWRTLLRARAIENTVYVMAACLSQPWYVGHSTIIDPMGVILGELDEEPGNLSAEIESARVEEVRSLIPSIKHRRM